MKTNVTAWIIAGVVSAPLAGGGAYAVHNMYEQAQRTVVQPINVKVDINEEKLGSYIVAGLDRKAQEARALDKAQADAKFCHAMRGMPGFDKTGVCR